MSSLQNTFKIKSNDAMNTYSYAVHGEKCKKKDKQMIKRKFRSAVKKDTMLEIRRSS